ncbi:MAG: ATP-binding protein [Candidatus Bathyarchaeia archaeon]
MTDPRTAVINQRLSLIRRIIAVSSGKGGVGKSMVATTLALALAKRGCRVGLLDLDFTSPSTNLILGAENAKPKEDKGLIPPTVHGLEYMSLVYYTRENPAPLRGEDTSNVLIELLAVTLWSRLDYLIMDMPPGIGDAVLDLIRIIPRVEFLVVTTPSQLAFETVKKLVTLLQELNVPIVGVVENMKRTKTRTVQPQTEQMGLKFLAEIPYDPRLEAAIGNPQRLLGTALGRKVASVAQDLVR